MWALSPVITPYDRTFIFLELHEQRCEIGGHTFSISDKNEDPPQLQVQKSNRMKYHYDTKLVSCHLAIIRQGTNMTLKSH